MATGAGYAACDRIRVNQENDMSKTGMPHVEDGNARRPAPSIEKQPPSHANPDKYTNSGYPGGGDSTQPGKDEFGRDAAQQKQAELTPQEGAAQSKPDRSKDDKEAS
jgi:hypothetical protein